MRKYLLLFIVFILVLISLAVFTNLRSSQRETVRINKAKYLCDAAQADCKSNNVHELPKGVCSPGGKCS